MVAYLNLCFRALDELGQSFENAKRTRDYLVTLQRRWQAHMRRSGSATKRQISSANLQSLSSNPLNKNYGRAVNAQGVDSSRKKTRLSVSKPQPHMQSASAMLHGQQQHFSQQPLPPHQQQQSYQTPFSASQLGDLDWIRDSDLRLLSETHGPHGNSHAPPNGMAHISPPPFPEDPNMLADLGDIDGWWQQQNNVSGTGGPSL
jgi:hypothetical protein